MWGRWKYTNREVPCDTNLERQIPILLCAFFFFILKQKRYKIPKKLKFYFLHFKFFCHKRKKLTTLVMKLRNDPPCTNENQYSTEIIWWIYFSSYSATFIRQSCGCLRLRYDRPLDASRRKDWSKFLISSGSWRMRKLKKYCLINRL